MSRNASPLIRRLTYPVVTISACTAFYVMAKNGVPAAIAAYVPVLAALGAIVFSEWRWPYRDSWRPTRQSLISDATFTLLIQVALPALLSLGYILIANSIAEESGWQLRSLWPHSLPSTAQVVLMVLVADLLRYPLHVAMHRKPWLWRLHAVHHSPDQLYWLNVGRFHPLEKSFQGLLDVLPFVVVGVGDWVLAGYFVFYAINGFFQHSNCDVELGPLNYLISGPELHRWHHSIDPDESATNFGNNVIVWDVLFGTRSLRVHRDVGAIGNGDPDYPQGFLDSMSKPFS